MASAMASAMASDAASRAPPGMKHKMAMSHEERLAEGSRYRAEGNAFFRAGDVTAAEESYRRGAELFDVMQCESPHDPTPAAQNAASIALAAPLFTNLALCLARRGAWSECADACTECFDLEPENEKALLRRAEARVEIGTAESFDDAARDLARATKLRPESPLTRETVKRVRASLAAARRRRDARDAETLSGCFDKLNADCRRRASRAENDDMDAVDGATNAGLYDAADVAPPGEAFPVSGARAAPPLRVDDLDAAFEEIDDDEEEARRKRREEFYNQGLRSGAIRLVNPGYY